MYLESYSIYSAKKSKILAFIDIWNYIGESISNFIDSDSWEFSDADDGFINKECAGVVIRCDLEDASIEEIRENQSELYVAEISVFE